jgi:hypothetical protein
MEEKINVAEILKDKPQGTKLYDLLYNIDVELDTISTTDKETVAWCTNETDNNTTCHRGYSEFGTVRGCTDGLQILLPSKEMRDWRKFNWKKGDVLVNKDGDVYIIFERFADDTYCSFVGKYYLWKENNDTEHFYKNERLLTSDFQKAGKDAAQTYISTIEERLGGKLNRETLEVEKAQPEFKDGDIVVYGKSVAICRKICKHTLFPYVSIDETSRLLFNDNPNVSPDECRFAKEEEKQQLFDALEKEGKAWDAEKKEVVCLKPKVELKPFDKVLVRDDETSEWKANFYSQMGAFGGYECISGVWGDCIPYEGNEHLLGTTNNVEG